MSARQSILTAARTDLLTINGTGSFTNDLKTAFKSFRYLDSLAISEFDSCYIHAGLATRERLPDYCVMWELPLVGLTYFKCNTDTTNQGLLETKAETLIADLELVTWSNIKAVGLADDSARIESVELLSIAPYITELEDRGVIYFELKVTYY